MGQDGGKCALDGVNKTKKLKMSFNIKNDQTIETRNWKTYAKTTKLCSLVQYFARKSSL